MRRLLLVVLALLASPATAVNVCPNYGPIHDKEVLPRIKSGIPFKLLSIAASEQQSSKRIVRIEYDLWNETLQIEVLGQKKTSSTLKNSLQSICEALSLPDVGGSKIQYRLLLNPALGEGLQNLKSKIEDRSGLLEINWERLTKDLDTEKTLIESEIKG